MSAQSEPVLVLLQLQDDYRKASLSRPKGKEAYDFGEMVGINKGLQMAIDKLTDDTAKQTAAEKAGEEMI